MTSAELSLDDIVLRRITNDSYEPQLVSPLIEVLLDEPRLVGRTLSQITKIIPKEIVAGVIDVNDSNLPKLYVRRYLSRTQSESISDLAILWAEMRMVFRYNSAALALWSDSRLPVLNARKPKELMLTLPGRKVLRDLLARMRDGDFS